MATLREAKIGDTVTVKRIHGEGALKRRIMDMALPRVCRSMYEKLHRWAIQSK